MNKKSPYEEELAQQLNDLPLPDENVAWEDMKRRLDDDSDDGGIVPPPQRGCYGYSLLLVLLAVILWLIVRPDKWFWRKEQENIVSSEKIRQNKKDSVDIKNDTKDSQKNSSRYSPSTITSNDIDSTNDTAEQRLSKDLLKTNHKKAGSQKIVNPGDVTLHTETGSSSTGSFVQKKTSGSIKENKKKRNKKIHDKVAGRLKSEISGNEANADSSKSQEQIISGHQDSTTVPNPAIIDSITRKAVDSTSIKKKIKDVPAKAVKKDSAAKKLIYFAAGIALQQQLPVDGQKLIPYNSLGRKGTLGDYIPSVYVRMYKDQKWFLQSEFRYGAPQYTKEILYVQKKVVDTFTRTTLSTSNRLKKTYYHQLPVSFNYFVLPRFSVGLGFVWNKFSSAVLEEEIKKTNNITQVDSIESQAIFHSKKADSNFVKSYFQALIETQYQWKRWSFGARYSFGLEPYLRFQLSGGEHRDEKNSSLQIFIRYDLWRSEKK